MLDVLFWVLQALRVEHQDFLAVLIEQVVQDAAHRLRDRQVLVAELAHDLLIVVHGSVNVNFTLGDARAPSGMMAISD